MSESFKAIMSQFCPKCEEWMPFDTHTCPPAWLARFEGEGRNNEWNKVYAEDAKVAAEKFCMRHDARGDYDVAHEGGADVAVANMDASNPVTFTVAVRSEPTYTARKKEVSI